MVRIDITYQGGLRCLAVHGPSGTQLATDAPTDNHGRGESFSPTDLVATALGTCIVTLMGIAAERKGIDLRGTTVQVEKIMATAPARRIGRLETVVTLPRKLAPDERKLLETAALGCPVKKSLHPDVEIDLRFVYPAG